MMKWGLTTFLLLLFPIAAFAQMDRLGFMQMARALARVEAMQENGHINMGTGVLVAPGRIVTNCHVSGNAVRVSVIHGGMAFPANAQRVDWKHDVCLLQVEGVEGPLVTLGQSSALAPAASVTAIGFSGGYEIQFSNGQVRALYPLDGGRIIKSSTAFTSGASGGGLFDENGRLVGVLTFRLRGSDQQYFSMPVEWFGHWLESEDGFKPLGTSDFRPPLWQESMDGQPLFMRATTLELAQRWSDLLAVADTWTREDSGSAEAWLARGKAEAALGLPQDAERDMERSVSLEPRLAEGWLALVQFYQAKGRTQDMNHARDELVHLDQGLAEALDDGDAK
jgi:serine protease Do